MFAPWDGMHGMAWHAWDGSRLFIVENVLHMVSVGLWGYLTDPLMVLDITVVTLAFGFEVHELEQLHSKEDPGGSSAAGVRRCTSLCVCVRACACVVHVLCVCCV